MGLNIKNERVCTLAKEAAALTGKTQTSAIEEALEKLIAEHSEERLAAQRYERLMGSLARFDALVTDEDRAAARTFMDEMYDENGLPQ